VVDDACITPLTQVSAPLSQSNASQAPDTLDLGASDSAANPPRLYCVLGLLLVSGKLSTNRERRIFKTGYVLAKDIVDSKLSVHFDHAFRRSILPEKRQGTGLGLPCSLANITVPAEICRENLITMDGAHVRGFRCGIPSLQEDGNYCTIAFEDAITEDRFQELVRFAPLLSWCAGDMESQLRSAGDQVSRCARADWSEIEKFLLRLLRARQRLDLPPLPTSLEDMILHKQSSVREFTHAITLLRDSGGNYHKVLIRSGVGLKATRFFLQYIQTFFSYQTDKDEEEEEGAAEQDEDIDEEDEADRSSDDEQESDQERRSKTAVQQEDDLPYTHNLSARNQYIGSVAALKGTTSSRIFHPRALLLDKHKRPTGFVAFRVLLEDARHGPWGIVANHHKEDDDEINSELVVVPEAQRHGHLRFSRTKTLKISMALLEEVSEQADSTNMEPKSKTYNISALEDRGYTLHAVRHAGRSGRCHRLRAVSEPGIPQRPRQFHETVPRAGGRLRYR